MGIFGPCRPGNQAGVTSRVQLAAAAHIYSCILVTRCAVARCLCAQLRSLPRSARQQRPVDVQVVVPSQTVRPPSGSGIAWALQLSGSRQALRRQALRRPPSKSPWALSAGLASRGLTCEVPRSRRVCAGPKGLHQLQPSPGGLPVSSQASSQALQAPMQGCGQLLKGSHRGSRPAAWPTCS